MGSAQHHHRFHRFAPVAVLGRDDARLLNRWVAEHQCLHLGRPDLEAAGVDHALEPVGQKEIAVFIHTPQVTRAEKPLALELDERRSRGVGPLPVALKHLGAVDDDLALLTHRHLLQRVRVNHTGIRAHEGDSQALLLGIVRRVGVRRRSGFGQSIPLGITQPILLQQPLCYRLRHGSTATADVDQARQVIACKMRAGQQVNHHGGDVRPVRHLPA